MSLCRRHFKFYLTVGMTCQQPRMPSIKPKHLLREVQASLRAAEQASLWVQQLQEAIASTGRTLQPRQLLMGCIALRCRRVSAAALSALARRGKRKTQRRRAAAFRTMMGSAAAREATVPCLELARRRAHGCRPLTALHDQPLLLLFVLQSETWTQAVSHPHGPQQLAAHSALMQRQVTCII